MATIRDDFNGNSINRDIWQAIYTGNANGDYSWSPNDLKVGNGELTISMTDHGDHWTAGGLSQGSAGQAYGHFEIRAKVDPGQGTGAGIMLWPASNGWPPEVDLLETPEGDRSAAHFTLHWPGSGGWDEYESRSFAVDTSQWHTYAVDWQPGKLTYSIDGQQRFSTTEHVPTEPMSVAMMGYVAKDNENWFSGGPDDSTPDQVNLHVDYVSISDSGSSNGGGTTAPVVTTPVVTEPEPVAPTPATPERISADGGDNEPHWVANGVVDWNAYAAQLYANFEASGNWWI